MIILINAEKAFDNIQHDFITKIFNKLKIGGKFLNLITASTATYNYHHTE